MCVRLTPECVVPWRSRACDIYKEDKYHGKFKKPIRTAVIHLTMGTDTPSQSQESDELDYIPNVEVR